MTNFDDLPRGHFNLIVADPPFAYWHYSKKGEVKSPDAQYQTYPAAVIKQRFPIGELAAKDCLLLLWGSFSKLPEQLDCLSHWGFEYKSAFVWNKVSKHGKPVMGVGHRVRSMAEPILVATRGRPKTIPFPGAFCGERRRHSQKPERFYEIVARHCPDLTNRIDLFARQSRTNWMSWGDQLDRWS